MSGGEQALETPPAVSSCDEIAPGTHGDPPQISVVIPTLGRPRLAAKAVASALAQTLHAIEVIVVVDGPDAETADLLERQRDPRLRVVVLKQRRGNAGARNAGVDEAKADWIAFLDDDDSWKPEKLEKQLALALSIKGGLPIISCRFEAVGNGARFVWPTRYPRPNQTLSEYLFTRGGPNVRGAIQTSTMLVPKALFDQVRFDEELDRYVDLDWLLKADGVEGVSLHYVRGEVLSTYSMDDGRKRISNQAGWRRDVDWIRERRDLVTRRAYGGYCLTQASIRAEKTRDKGAFLPLLREALSRGKVSPGEMVFHVGNTLLPAGLRRSLTHTPERRRGRVKRSRGKTRERKGTLEGAMRVLIFSAAEKSDRGGVQGVVHQLTDHLRGEGHAVVTAWPDGAGTGGDWRLQLEAGVSKTGRPTAGALIKASFAMAKLAARLARLRPDIVNLHYVRGQTIYFLALRRVFGFRLVLSFHGSDYHEASPALRARLPGWLRSADQVTAVSQELADKVTGLAPEICVEVIENGVDTRFWTPGPEGRHEPGLLVAAGRLLMVKGFDVLLAALARPETRKSRLVIAGKGSEEANLRRQIAGLGLTGRVELAGHLSRDDMRDLYRRASLFVLPSRREGMPLVLLEAMATGLPVVATAVGGVPEVVGDDTGALVTPEDPAELATAIGNRIERSELLKREGKAAHERAQAFGAHQSFARYENVFRR